VHSQTAYLRNNTSDEIAQFLLSLNTTIDKIAYHKSRLHALTAVGELSPLMNQPPWKSVLNLKAMFLKNSLQTYDTLSSNIQYTRDTFHGESLNTRDADSLDT